MMAELPAGLAPHQYPSVCLDPIQAASLPPSRFAKLRLLVRELEALERRIGYKFRRPELLVEVSALFALSAILPRTLFFSPSSEVSALPCLENSSLSPPIFVAWFSPYARNELRSFSSNYKSSVSFSPHPRDFILTPSKDSVLTPF